MTKTNSRKRKTEVSGKQRKVKTGYAEELTIVTPQGGAAMFCLVSESDNEIRSVTSYERQP